MHMVTTSWSSPTIILTKCLGGGGGGGGGSHIDTVPGGVGVKVPVGIGVPY